MNEKQQQALRTVRRYMWFSAGAGLLAMQSLDGAAVASLQLKMVAHISKLYGVPFQENVGKAAIGSLAGFIVPHAAAVGAIEGIGTALKAIPGLGSVIGAPLTAAFAGAYTWAMGNMFIQHFESGGTFLNFNPEQVREYFKSQFDAGKTGPVPQPEASADK